VNAYDAIVFDYDGTLFDTRAATTHCLLRAFEEYGRPGPAAERVVIAAGAGLPLQDTFILLDRRLRAGRRALNELIGIYRKLYLDEGTLLLQPFAGVSDTLRQLHGSGIKCVVVSNKGIASIRRSLEVSNLQQFVDLIFGDAPGLPKKPDPAILIEHVLPRYENMQPRRMLIVGDTEIDILFAKRSGTSSCWASYGYGEVERCRRLSPEHEIASIDALPALINC
jgi:phosphoglycolate phosphatase